MVSLLLFFYSIARCVAKSKKKLKGFAFCKKTCYNEEKGGAGMRGIKLERGATFVEHKGLTVRILRSGKIGVSPIMFAALEWDLRTEPPSTWEYLTEGDIRALIHDAGTFAAQLEYGRG